MATQDDLTAERAADLIQSVFLANEKQWRAWYALANSGSAQQSAPDGVAQKLVDAVAAAIKTVRQEALREAARVAVDVLTETAARWDDFADLNEGGIKYTNIGFMRASARRCRDAVKQLDRLASEGG